MRKMFKDNLKNLIRKQSKGVAEFSKLVEMNIDNIYNYQNGKREPDFNILYQIKLRFREKTGKNINLDYLITGEGEMLISEIPSNTEIRETLAKLEIDIQDLKKK